jgi:ATP-dependent Clp protease ATP-binding subunit ClpC
MFERFTDRARKVMALAQEEARAAKSEYIDSVHILLSLIDEDGGVGAHVLKALHVTPKAVRTEVEKLVKPGTGLTGLGRLPQTPAAKKVIEHAIEESRKLNHSYVGTEHMLLGLFSVKESIAAAVLLNLGLKLEEVCKQVVAILGISEVEASGSGAIAPSTAGGFPKTPEDDVFSACSPTDALAMLGRLLLRELEGRTHKAKAAGDDVLAEEYQNIEGGLRSLLYRLARLRHDS